MTCYWLITAKVNTWCNWSTPAEYKLIHSSLSCQGAEGIESFCLKIKPSSPYFSSHRSRGTRLQYNISGRSHRWLGTHLREEHSASGSCHPRWPPQGRRQVAGGEKVKVAVRMFYRSWFTHLIYDNELLLVRIKPLLWNIFHTMKNPWVLIL